MKRKKIALVIYSLHHGGAEKVASELSICFEQLGHAVVVIVFDNRDRVYEYGGQLIDLNLPSADSGSLLSRFLFLIQRARRLRGLYRKQAFDLIIAVMESAGFASGLASRDTLIANHCNPQQNFSHMEWRLAGYIFPRVRRVITVSKQGEVILRQRLGLLQLQTIYNPVSYQRIHSAAREKPTFALPERPYLFAAGRLEHEKRFDRLLNAYARSIAREHFDLLILGQGSLEQALRRQIQQLGLENQVMMPGYTENPYPYMHKAYCTVLSSDHEGFPMILIESLSLGRPVISMDCPTGPDEIIVPEQNGLLVTAGDETALVLAINRLVEDKRLYQQLADNAAPSVARLDISHIARQWLALSKGEAGTL